MADTVYAVAENVPGCAPYIIQGKLYPAIADDGFSFTFVDEEDDRLLAIWGGCAHLDGAKWTRVTEITPVAAPTKVKGVTQMVMRLEGSAYMPDVICLNGVDYVRSEPST